MTDFRNAQNRAHPSKTNTLLLGVVCVLILIMMMQIWLLTAALNTALGGDGSVKWPAFWTSAGLFLGGAALLRYLPLPIRHVARAQQREVATSRIAWRTLVISMLSLTLAFSVWFMWSAIPLHLNEAGFRFSRQQLFWLAATPVILGALLRIPYGLFVSRFGSRRSLAVVTLLMLAPCLATGMALMNPNTPFWGLLICSALTGIAGANFATSMGVVNLWFPKHVQGTALGINGLGNLGVTVAQLAIPTVIGLSIVRASGGPATGTAHGVHLENAAFIWIPFILVMTAAIWFGTRDYPTAPKSLVSQLAAGKKAHTWIVATLYFLTFGCFVAMGASLPLIIKDVFAARPGGAPNPLHFAPWAAAVGTLARPVGGWLADRYGAGRVTAFAIAAMALGGFSLSAFLAPSQFSGFFAVTLVICGAAGLGNGSVFRIIPAVLASDAGATIGIVSCVGALGGFIPPLLLGWALDSLGSAAVAYTAMAVFAVLCFVLNAWFYVRRGSPHCC